MSEKKITIGLTNKARQSIDYLVESGYFKTMIDAAKFAFALAIKEEVEPGKTEGAETVWNVGSFDPDDELRKLIPIFYNDIETPYSLIEHLINEGLYIIGQKMDEDKSLDFIDLIKEVTAK